MYSSRYWSNQLPKPRSLLALAALIAVLGSVQSAVAVDLFAPGKDDRPPGEVRDYQGHSFPCDNPVQHLTLVPSQRYTLTGSTTGAPSMVDTYGCEPSWPETGPEHLYILTATDDLILDAWLTNNVPDHDLILLSACHTDSCLVQANTELSGTLRRGRTYYLMVDGYDNAAGQYTLILETRYPGIAPSICEPGGAIALDLSHPTPDLPTATLTGAANLVSIYDCTRLTWLGGEVWYALTLAAADREISSNHYGSHMRLDVVVTTDVPTLDLALWLFDGCGPDAVCLAFSDQGNAGQSESLSWANLSFDPVTVYLAVDSRRLSPPDDEGLGHFNLQLDVTVATSQRSLSQIRNLFR